MPKRSTDPSRDVVDHGVQIGACPVEQADDGGVDVPQLFEDIAGGRPRETVRAVTTTRAGRGRMSVETALLLGDEAAEEPFTARARC